MSKLLIISAMALLTSIGGVLYASASAPAGQSNGAYVMAPSKASPTEATSVNRAGLLRLATLLRAHHVQGVARDSNTCQSDDGVEKCSCDSSGATPHCETSATRCWCD